MSETTILPGVPEPVDLMRAAELALTARQDTSDGLVARERLVPVVGVMVTEIGVLRETVTAYREDLKGAHAYEALGERELARSVRLEWPSIRAAINPDVHTPARAVALLKARGWEKVPDRRSGAVWQNEELERSAFVPMDTSFADWDKRMAELVHDLADAYGTGELGVLADIVEAENA
jgi:hypothetical protein